MYPAERQSEIVRLARTGDGSVMISALTDHLEVTAETIRRDLSVLERQGILHRHRGGAILRDPEPFEAAIGSRNERERDAKLSIAARIVELLPDDGVVMMDSGSTTHVLAEVFPDRELTVVTNNIPAISLLAERPRLSVFALPGRVRHVTHGAVDLWGWQRLAKLRGDVAIVGANGVTSHGATTTIPEEAALKSALVKAARFRVLAVTSSKLGRESFCRYADLDEFDVVVTDSAAPPDIADEIRAAGPELILA
ncbi:DeoR/GlpR family DNA-binding transcription regulator [Microbacterium sp. JB110]|uniref:DeoR/GlpR family DNA-binding transcription regulator n=1 Tax=Microbacterium sp. JB110 TaxID=2024477 RepID=UPI00097F59E4|nr:DeoR/GlpR family DNA-binding transcription regulator [Microbacterium sp. JB110]SJM47271.1 Transcriptional repressor of the fructose operon, DeoR family [Frigoribacterium sp. JB110]